MNLTTVMLVIFLYYLKICIAGFLRIAILFTDGEYGTQKFYNILTKNMFFTEILAISIESYLEFLINAYLTFYRPLDTAAGEKISLVMTF